MRMKLVCKIILGCVLYFEFLNHPYYTTTDIVMSLWFCREGTKQFMRSLLSGPNIY